MKISVPLTCISSRQWFSEKDKKNMVTLQVAVMGQGVAKLTVDEKMVPDIYEGQQFVGLFSVGISKELKFYLRFEGIE